MSIKTGLLCVLHLKMYIREKGGLEGEAIETLTRSYYFEPPLSKKCSRATAKTVQCFMIFSSYVSQNLFSISNR